MARLKINSPMYKRFELINSSNSIVELINLIVTLINYINVTCYDSSRHQDNQTTTSPLNASSVFKSFQEEFSHG